MRFIDWPLVPNYSNCSTLLVSKIFYLAKICLFVEEILIYSFKDATQLLISIRPTQNRNAVSHLPFIFESIFENKLILLNLTKEPKKSNDIMCTSSIECDASQGLSCQGPDGAKTCQFLKIFFLFLAILET